MSEPNIALGKKLRKWAIAITVVVLGLVVMMRSPYKIPLPDGWDFGFLPAVNAGLNSLAALFLLIALYEIKQKNISAHRKAMYGALGCSALFLLCYVAYHFTTVETLFGDINGDKIVDAEELVEAGTTRTVYFIILFSHILLAAISFPFILFTFIYAYTNQFDKHRKLARRVFPIWFYVAITGPIVYLMLKPYYA